MDTLTPFLLFKDNAEGAAEFRVSIVPNSKITRVTPAMVKMAKIGIRAFKDAAVSPSVKKTSRKTKSK